MNAWIVATVVIALLSVSRTARLIVFDDYPPMVWLRARWDSFTGYDPYGVGWGKLLHCAFCATPYLALGMLAWTAPVEPWNNPLDAWSADWWWFVANATWGLSYVSAMLVAWDQPPGE